MPIVLAILSGTALGYTLERGDMCFHSTIRGLFKAPRQLDLFRAYILALLIATPIVVLLRSFGLINPWIPPFTLRANIVGGLIFGVGMVVASSCITGFFYKLGHGMLGVIIGLITWGLGDIIVYQGPLSGMRSALTANPITNGGAVPTIDNLRQPFGLVVLGILALVAVYWLWKSPKSNRRSREKLWGWVPLGISVGLIMNLSWLLAKAGGTNYPYGTSYVPTQIYKWITAGEMSSPWIPITLISLILGAIIAALHSGTMWVRGESMRRYLELAGGGFLMGVGAAIAGGCNLGHGLVGVSLLSIGSITTVVAMVFGVFLANWAGNFWSRIQSSKKQQYIFPKEEG